MTAFAKALPLAAAILAASMNFAAAGSDNAADTQSELRVAALGGTVSAPAPAPSVTPGIREIKAERVVSGSEPDPETFDQAGLETWWKRHHKIAK
jgi:hypothetical protein